MALFCAPGRLLNAFCACCCVCCRFWSVFLRLGGLRARFSRGSEPSEEGFGGPMALFFEIFACMRACTARHAPCAQNTIKTDAKRISANQRATQKTSKVRFKTLSNRAFYKDCAKNSSFGSQGLVLKGSGSLLGNSWAPLGWLLAALGGSCSLWAASGASLGRLLGAHGCILAAKGGPGLDFGTLGAVPGWVLEASGSMFWHAFGCASHFVT